MVRDTRAAVGNNFLGSLESFLAYLDALMSYCELFLEDEAAGAAMRVPWPLPAYKRINKYLRQAIQVPHRASSSNVLP